VLGILWCIRCASALLPCLKVPPSSVGLVADHEATRCSPWQRFLFLVRSKGVFKPSTWLAVARWGSQRPTAARRGSRRLSSLVMNQESVCKAPLLPTKKTLITIQCKAPLLPDRSQAEEAWEVGSCACREQARHRRRTREYLRNPEQSDRIVCTSAVFFLLCLALLLELRYVCAARDRSSFVKTAVQLCLPVG